LPEAKLVHLLTRRETTLGRALSNDILLMDPTVSREHARLVLDDQGWHVYNLTLHNIVRVNGRPVSSGGSLPVQAQDFLVLGSTVLQLIAPQPQQIGWEYQTVDPGAATQQMAVLSPSAPVLSEYQPSPPTNVLDGNGQHDGTHVQNDGKQSALGEVLSPKSSWSPSPPSTPQVADEVLLLPEQPEPELEPLPWEDNEEEKLLGVGVTMQFALPQRMGKRTRWLMGGAGIAIVVISALITLIINSVIGINALVQNGPTSILQAVTIPLIPAIVIILLVNFMDRFEREPWFLRLGAFLWGAVIAVPPALLIEERLGTYIQTASNNVWHSALVGLNAGVTEETIKGLGLLLLFIILRDEFDNVTDGIVYGALIGAGFALVENFIYFASNSNRFLLILIVGRVVLGWLSHSTFTVCFGAALGYVRHTRIRWRQILIPVAGYLIAVGLHSVFDFIDFLANGIVLNSPNDPTVVTISLVAVIGDYVPPFIAQLGILYILIKALAHEAAVIREFLATEVSSGVVHVDEYALLQNSFQRTREERRVLRHSGFKQWLRVKALYQTEIGLAFRKWHVSMGDKPKQGPMQPEDAYRQRIKRLRQEIIMAEARKK
jgi:RsiW-degrading membrane proteinase PrsW (M82 family)